MCEELCRTLGLHSVAGSIFPVIVVDASPLRAFRRTWGNVQCLKTCVYNFLPLVSQCLDMGFSEHCGEQQIHPLVYHNFPNIKMDQNGKFGQRVFPTMNSGGAPNQMERQIWRHISTIIISRSHMNHSGFTLRMQGFESMNNRLLVAIIYPWIMSTWMGVSIFFSGWKSKKQTSQIEQYRIVYIYFYNIWNTKSTNHWHTEIHLFGYGSKYGRLSSFSLLGYPGYPP